MSDSLVRIGAAPREPRPEWLRIRLRTPRRYHDVKGVVERLELNTVCQEARCPNIYECWGEHGTATFMILGDVCTRRCGFCAVTTGRPQPGVDSAEPERVAEAVAAMGIEHAVVTSVDRDDLPDGGASHFAAVVAAVHGRSPGCAVEVLTPDFRGAAGALDAVLEAAPEVFSHNMETVPRLYREARPGSRYGRSLALLAAASAARDRGAFGGVVKSGIMLGLGETGEEVARTLRDIRDAGVEVLTLGQYMQPTRRHLPVDRWVHPDEFARHREDALSLGFEHCEAGPLVRSSYHAHAHLAGARGEAARGRPAPPHPSTAAGRNEF
ncbi:MAG: lipoyl synthase [Acidobacteriota bacterium]|nr:lipoyl synthase [Acidobacteriota bacterium]MDH3523718.1 lipoyl synthase [Acidobacteriota bacterium]